MQPTSGMLSEHLWRLAKEENAGDQALSSCTLLALSTAVVELSGLPALDTRADYMLLAKSIAHAQLFGLHLSAKNWRITGCERELRQNLWWSLRIHDAWSSFLSSRPSHMQPGNTSVPLPPRPVVMSTCTPSDSTLRNDPTSPSFFYLCTLSCIVSDLQNSLCVVSKAESARHSLSTESLIGLETNLAVLADETSPYLHMIARPPGMGMSDWLSQHPLSSDFCRFWLVQKISSYCY